MKITTAQLLAYTLFASSSALSAVTSLDPGTSVALFGTTAAEDPTLPGLVVEDFLQAFELADPAGEPLTGIFSSRVAVRFDTGQIDLSWRISSLQGATGQIESVSITGYDGWSVGVEWRIDGLGDLGPSGASRSVDADTVGFTFSPTLGFPNANASKSFFTRTDAFDYAFTGTATLTLTNGESITLPTWAPAVPAPGGVALLAMAGLCASRRRRS